MKHFWGDVAMELPSPVRATDTTLLEDVTMGPVGEGTSMRSQITPWGINTLRLTRGRSQIARGAVIAA